MNIDEAIERNLTTKNELSCQDFPTRAIAIQLGIEALKRVKAQRGPGGAIGALGLPGETE